MMEQLPSIQKNNDNSDAPPENPAELTATIERAQLFSDRGWFNEAIEMFERLVEENGDDPVLMLEYGNTLFKKGDLRNAGVVFRRITEIRPDRIEGWNNLGIVQLTQEDNVAAFESFSHVLSLEPQNTGALLNVGNCHFNNGDYTAARTCFEKACEVHPDLPDGWYNLGNTCIRLGEIKEARQALEKALRYHRDFPSALKNLGWIYEEEGRLADAEQCYAEALLGSRSDSALHVNLGNVYVKLHRYDEAKKSYLAAIRLAPHGMNGWMGLRGLALAKGDVATFVRSTMAVLGRLSDELLARSIEILFNLRQLDKADEVLTQAERIGRKGELFDALRLVILQYQHQSEQKQQIRFRRLRKKRHPSETVCRALARYCLNNEMYEETVRYVALIAQPDEVTMGLRWRAMIALGQVRKSRKEILEVLNDVRENGDLLFLLADIESRRGNTVRAKVLLLYALEYGFPALDEIEVNPALKKCYGQLTGNVPDAKVE